MVSQSEIRTSNSRISHAHTPRVAVFVGGTAGIGKGALEALISKETPIKVYVIGRNKEGREPFLRGLKTSNSRAEVIWLEGQVTLLAEVKRLCAEIKGRESRIDLVFMSQGFLPWNGRHETSEGLEISLSLLYWSRMLFALHLLPLLTAANVVAGQSYTPRLISILGAGLESADIPFGDIDLRDPKNFSLPKVAVQSATLNTVALGKLAAQPDHSGVVFIHNHPGEVKTEIFRNGWGGGQADPATPLPEKRGISLEMSGERSLYLMTSAQFGGNGTPLGQGCDAGVTVAGTKRGALFCVDERIQCLVPNGFLQRLRLKNGEDIAWKNTLEVLKPYL